jgi:hypothetical protein
MIAKIESANNLQTKETKAKIRRVLCRQIFLQKQELKKIAKEQENVRY